MATSSQGDEDYSTWTWQQIKQAILGSVDISTADEDKQLADTSDSNTIFGVASKFVGATTTIDTLKQNLSDSLTKLIGPRGSWNGDAAEALNTTMATMLKGIGDYLEPITNGGYSNPLDRSGNQLNAAIETVRAADKKAAQDTVDRYSKEPNATQENAPWQGSGDSAIVDVSRYPDIEQQLTASLREAITTLANEYKSATTDMKEPIQHAFFKGGKVIDTPAVTSIGAPADTPGAASGTTARKSATGDTKSSSAKPAHGSSSDDGNSGKDSNDGNDGNYEKASSSQDGNSNSSRHAPIAKPHFTNSVTSPDGGSSQSSVSPPHFSNDSANSPHQNAFLLGPGSGHGIGNSPGSRSQSSLTKPDLSGLDDDFKSPFDPETHVESYDPSLLGGPGRGGRIQPPQFRDGPSNLPGFEHPLAPDDLPPSGPIGSSLLSRPDTQGKPIDFRSGNPPPPRLSNLRGLGPDSSLGRGLLGADGQPLTAQAHNGSPFEEHSYRGNGFLSEEEMTASSLGQHGPGGFPGAGENPMGQRGMPMGGGMGGGYRGEEEHAHRGQDWLREDEDVWEREKKDDRRRDESRGRR